MSSIFLPHIIERYQQVKGLKEDGASAVARSKKKGKSMLQATHTKTITRRKPSSKKRTLTISSQSWLYRGDLRYFSYAHWCVFYAQALTQCGHWAGTTSYRCSVPEHMIPVSFVDEEGNRQRQSWGPLMTMKTDRSISSVGA